MPRNMLDWGSAWLGRTMAVHAGRRVAYRRRATGETATLAVWAGKTEREQVEREGLTTVARAVDRLLPTADFEKAFGAGVRPAEGDEVEDRGRLLRVRPIGREAAWLDEAGGTLLRIHLKDEGTVG